MDTTNLNKTISSEDFSKRIEDVLAYKSYSKKQLADACGFSISNLSRWKTKGMLPDLETGVRIADFLNVPLYWLITGRNERGEIPVHDFKLLQDFHSLNEGDKEVITSIISAFTKRYISAGFEKNQEVE